jgi:hypothetical protein
MAMSLILLRIAQRRRLLGFSGIIARGADTRQRDHQEEMSWMRRPSRSILPKDVFQVAVANRAGRILDRQRFTRRQFERFIDTLVDDTDVIMESCGTSHYWGRRMQARWA